MNRACINKRRALQRYADGEFTDDSALKTLKAHLEACPGCSQELEYLLRAKKIVSSHQRVNASPEFVSRLLDRLKPAPEIIRLRWVDDAADWSRRLIPVPVAVTVLVCVVLFARLNQAKAPDYILGGLTRADIRFDEVYLDSSSVVDRMFFGK